MTTASQEINQSAMDWFRENYRREPEAFEFAIMTGFAESFVGKTEQVEAQQ
jgi:hypothetical protein